MRRYPAPSRPTSPDEEPSTSRRFYRWLLAPIALLLLLAHMLRLFFFPGEDPPLLPLSRRGQEIFVIIVMIMIAIGFVFLLFPGLLR